MEIAIINEDMKMKGKKVVVGIFTYVDDAIKAITATKESKLDYDVYSPTYVPDLEHAVSDKRSLIGIISIIGGLTGLTAGFTLAIMCSLDWPMRVSSKAIVSIPGFVVIGYEWTILFTALFTLGGIALLCRLPNPFRKVGYHESFSRDKFGVVVGCDDDNIDSVKESLLSAGADEVLVKEGL